LRANVVRIRIAADAEFIPARWLHPTSCILARQDMPQPFDLKG
jgi:hypothetical protein